MKIGALVPVRLSSQRMPGKALMPIMGRPAILHLLDRLFASKHLELQNVVLCTTTDSSDDPLVPVAESLGARVFRGSRDNIIDRFHAAVAEFAFDAVIQADGDDPCSDTTYMDLCMDRLLAEPELDIVLTEGVPLGLGSKAIRASAIRRVWSHHLTQQNDTGFIYFFTRTGLCKTARIRPQKPEHITRKGPPYPGLSRRSGVFRSSVQGTLQAGNSIRDRRNCFVIASSTRTDCIEFDG